MESMKGLQGEGVKVGDDQVGLNMKEQMEKHYRSLGEVFGIDPIDVQPFIWD